ncbi:MAG: 3-oxoacyl-ACP reductase [Gammaproteobacteria bacterium]|nr:3-oxoacyl-ACP reductase [Gammaproteobacteria bacterium]
MGKNTTTTWDLTGQVALITGASRGIGAACAESMAHAGAHVIAVARSQSDLESLSERTEGVVEIWVEDIGNSSFRKRVEKLERLDILFNNAGTNSPQPFINLSEDALDEMIQLNVRALFLSAQSAVKVMLSAGNGGSIINMSSQMGHIGAQNRTAYCMTKHAVEGLTKALGVELASQGIRVNSVAPTFIDTPMTEPMFEDKEFKQWALDCIPMGRIGQLSEVVSAVMFLASSDSSLMTGASLKIDGGWTAR